MSQVELLSHQILHFKRVLEILKDHKAYLDTSQMGAGKTYLTIKVAQVLKLKMLVVAPVSTISMWKKTAEEYGVELVDVLSYAGLRGTKNGVKHPWLDRTQDEFWASKDFTKLVNEGVLVVFDEMHNLKNKATAQIYSAHSLAIEVAASKGVSRIALLSATPCDKAVHTESIFKMLGIITHDELYVYEREGNEFGAGEYVLTGFKEASKFCKKWNPDVTKEILSPNNVEIAITRRNADKLTYELYTQVAKKIISSDMTRPQILAKKDVKNGFYNLSAKKLIEMKKAVAGLSRAVGYDGDRIDGSKGNLGAVTTNLLKIENIKVDIYSRLIKDTLDTNPQAKVVVFMSYKEPMSNLASELRAYKPMIMNGQTIAKNRDVIVSKFQEYNTKNRLLIAQIKVGGIGISLDDRHGEYPRYAFITPTYFFIDLYQAGGRIYRTSTKSTATIRMIYGKESNNPQPKALEARILDAMARKTDVAKNMLANPNSERMPFPGEFTSEIEA